VVHNHARKTDARRRSVAEGGSHRSSLNRSRSAIGTRDEVRVPTGLTALDSLLAGGLRAGTLTALAARTAMGKSMLALTIARNVAIRYRLPAQFTSLEMSHRELMDRLLAAESGIRTEKFRRRIVSDQELQFVKQTTATAVRSAPLYLGGDMLMPGFSDLGGVERSSQRIVDRHGRLALLVVDYLGLVGTARSDREQSRDDEVDAILTGLGHLARRLHAAVLVVEQLTGAPEDRDDHRPRHSDLWHPGLLNHANTLIGLHRASYYDLRHRTGRFDRSPDPELYAEDWFPREGLPEPAVQRAELIVLRNRSGATGTVEVSADLSRARFYDLPQ